MKADGNMLLEEICNIQIGTVGNQAVEIATTVLICIRVPAIPETGGITHVALVTTMFASFENKALCSEH